MDINVLMLAVFVVTTFGAFIVKGLTGFGPALFIVPVFGLFLPLSDVVPISGALLLVSNIPLALTGWGSVPKRMFIPTAASFSLGVSLGARLLVVLPEAMLFNILSVTLVAFCFYQLWGGRDIQQPPAWHVLEAVRLSVAAVVSGLLVGAVGAGALPLIVYLGLRYPKANFRMLLTYVFLVGSTTQVIVYSLRGLYDPLALGLTALLMVPMLVGVWTGLRLFGSVNQRVFNRAIGALLMLPALRLWFS
jgi:uncharacterized membrane protein YfcA